MTINQQPDHLQGWRANWIRCWQISGLLILAACDARCFIPNPYLQDSEPSTGTESGSQSGTLGDTTGSTQTESSEGTSESQGDTLTSTNTTEPAVAECGDGQVEGAEQCEPSNEYPNANFEDLYHVCTPMCTWQGSFCGDGQLQSEHNEQCDPGISYPNADDDSGYHVCLAPFCTWEGDFCGDGELQQGVEECDDGESNSDQSSCLSTCVQAMCGDGFLWDDTEQCDPGISYPNADDDSGYHVCNPQSCTWDGGGCGDGILQAEHEECDPAIAYTPQDDDSSYHVCNPQSCTWEGDFCGDGNVQELFEVCDDGNQLNNDGCEANCQQRTLHSVAAGGLHTCALWNSGILRCWGHNLYGQLGYGNTNDIGDNELPSAAGDIAIGEKVSQIVAGFQHTCALGESGNIYCWGRNNQGQLGYGHTNNIGDSITPESQGKVYTENPTSQLHSGDEHVCVLSGVGQLRCWGSNGNGQLGYENNWNNIGDNPGEMPPPYVEAGDDETTVVQVATGGYHTCALLSSGHVRCWGYGGEGQLGYENTFDLGGDPGEMPPADVLLGNDDVVVRIAAGVANTCVVLQSGQVRCWGANDSGQLGAGDQVYVGDKMGDMPPPYLAIGEPVEQLSVGTAHVCVRLAHGRVRCWGENDVGQLGSSHTNDFGDEDGELPILADDIDLGGKAVHVSTSNNHSCALLESGQVRCWGLNNRGQLGYGHTNNIGDNETPASAGNVPLF